MPILTILLVLIAVGVILWLVNRAPWIDAKIKTLINWLAIIFIVLWLLKLFGIFDALKSVRV